MARATIQPPRATAFCSSPNVVFLQRRAALPGRLNASSDRASVTQQPQWRVYRRSLARIRMHGSNCSGGHDRKPCSDHEHDCSSGKAKNHSVESASGTVTPAEVTESTTVAGAPSFLNGNGNAVSLAVEAPASSAAAEKTGLSGGCCDHDHSHDENTVMGKLIAMRHSLPVAVAGAIFLALSYVVPYVAVARAAVSASLLLTGLPAVAESTQRMISSRGRELDVDVLMAMAVVAAVATGAPAEGALLMTLYALSHAVEDAVTARARKNLDDLKDMAPTTAFRLPSAKLLDDSQGPEEVRLSDVAVGDFLLIRQGEVAPCDGVVTDGEAFVSLLPLTGETNPRAMYAGDTIPAGATAVDAPLVLRVVRTGAESTLARISNLVLSAQENRPKVTRFFDRYTKLYTRIVLVAAAVFAFILPAFMSVPLLGERGALKRSLGFLVASSPCALIVGAPVAYLSTLSSCARRGVLVKTGTRALDASAQASTVIFDKTGTLTTGSLELVDVLALPAASAVDASARPLQDALRPVEDADFARLVAIANDLERGAVHPIAAAIRRCAEANPAPAASLDLSSMKTIPGQGVQAEIAGVEPSPRRPSLATANVRLGKLSFAFGNDPVVDSLPQSISRDGEFLISGLQYGDERYVLRFRDEVRNESPEVVASLRRDGYKACLLTGDGEGSARKVEGAVGQMDETVANATPDEKLEYIRREHERATSSGSSGVVMVGDGVNDAPALAASSVGIACGLSSATAVHAADIVLVRNDIRDVTWYLRKARKTQAIVKQNLIIALILMLAATGPTLAGAVPLWLAVLLHEGGSVLVGLNGLRLLANDEKP